MLRAGADLVSIPAPGLRHGHSYLARQLGQRKIAYGILDNAFGWIADLAGAQKLANDFAVEMVHRKLDQFADRYCPVIRQFGLSYHWSLARPSRVRYRYRVCPAGRLAGHL